MRFCAGALFTGAALKVFARSTPGHSLSRGSTGSLRLPAYETGVRHSRRSSNSRAYFDSREAQAGRRLLGCERVA